MKKLFTKAFGIFRLSAALALLALVVAPVAHAAATPSLGVAASFGVLTRTYYNSSTFVTVNGDVGYEVAPSVSPSVNGATYIGGATFAQAVTDQESALTALNSQGCTFTFASGTINLATDITHGTAGVYTQGVYCVNGSMTVPGGATITLSGAGTFIFRPTGTITTSAFSHVTGTNGASACDAFWTPGGSTTIGSDGDFFGTVIEPKGPVTLAITVGDGTTWLGRALNGDVGSAADVTTAADVTITKPTCSSPTATLHVIKVFYNDYGGTAVPSDAIIHVNSSLGEVPGSPQPGTSAPGTAYVLSAGTYTVSENAISGYSPVFNGPGCDTSGNVILAPGDDKTCTVANDQNPPVSPPPATPPPPPATPPPATPPPATPPPATPPPATPPPSTPPPPPAVPSVTLHVVKIVVNDNGGKAVVSDAVVHVMSGLGDVSGSPHAGASTPGTAYALVAGTYNVSENFFAGYTVAIGGDCNASGDITLISGDEKTCTITNNDIAVITPPPPTTPPPPPPVTPVGCDLCARLSYDLYIINPDLSERHTGTAWVRVTDRGNGIKRYSFEDATIDPHNPLFDYNDSVIDVDYKDCKNVKFMFVSSDASWKHQVRIKVSIDGLTQSDTLVTNDSKAVVGTLKTINATTNLNTKLACTLSATATALKGRILLQVQQHGEAWYIHPVSGMRYYMKDGPTAYGMMRNFGLGITDKDLAAIPSVASVDALKASTSACSTVAASKVKGKILLQVQQHGEAWYVDVVKCRRIYMKDGAAAYTLMRFLGLGITDADLLKLGIGG